MATRPSKESVDAENQEAGDTMGELPGGMAKMQIPTTTANALSNRGPLSSNRGRQRRITKENMLGHDNLLAGTDEKGVRIRILTAQLTGWRAAKVFPDMEKAGLSQSKYVGETIPYDGETTPNGQSVTVPGKLRHGHGEITYADGSHFVGQWENDVRSGTGTFKFACGDVYEGEWKNGMYHGKGKYTGFKSDSYEGEWAEDQPHGYGSYTYKYQLNTAATLANRSFTYTGNWVAGKREGHHELLAGTDDQGVRIRIFTAQLTGMRAAKVFPGTKEGLTFSKYVGETIPYDGETTPNGQSVTVPGKLRHGQGEITYGDGSHFVGQWENDVRSGNGVFTYACGDVRSGRELEGRYTLWPLHCHGPILRALPASLTRCVPYALRSFRAACFTFCVLCVLRALRALHAFRRCTRGSGRAECTMAAERTQASTRTRMQASGRRIECMGRAATPTETLVTCTRAVGLRESARGTARRSAAMATSVSNMGSQHTRSFTP